ncbi:MAG: thioredoxin [Caldilinea sp.]|nr:thioredoxin [Caldilinea sp.]MCB0051991.1 thioredoxin [Caldilinea sp.]
MTITTVINTNVQSIDRVLATDMPVLLAFWRPTTPMTPAQEESLERLAQSYAGSAILARVDADAEPELARRFRVAGTPVYVLLRNGKAKLALASEEARNNVAGWLAHFVDGKPQPAVTEPSPDSAGSGGQVRTLTDATFQQTIDQPVPVLVDFWAPWCGPCRMVAPSVEKLAQEYAGRAVVGKLNVDENQGTARRFQVMSIPTLLIFKNGQVVDQIVGAQPYQALQQHLARFV